MTGGTSKKEVCLDLGKKNIEALRLLLKEFRSDENLYQIKIMIRKANEQVELDNREFIFRQYHLGNEINDSRQSME
jgi:hypothetical protein